MFNHSTSTFIEQLLGGEALTSEIDDFVDAWHSSASELSLRSSLGMTPAEYSLWLSDADMLDAILTARHKNIALTEVISYVVNDNHNLAHGRLAARSNDITKIPRLTRWLKSEGIV